MWDKFKNIIDNAKYIIATWTMVVMVITGAYTWMSHYFVTTSYAEELIGKYTSEIEELKSQTKSLQSMVLEDRLIRYEEKLAKGEVLTPTEKRQYEKLKKEYEGQQ